MKREQGFTLLELMVTILILSVMLGLGIPGFSRWLPNYRLKGAARDIYSNLQYAKMTAVKDRASCGVLFDVANSRYLVVNSGPNSSFESTSAGVAGDDVALKTVDFSEYGSGVGYGHGTATQTAKTVPDANWDNDVTFPGDGIVFDSRGMTLSPAGAASTDEYFVYLQNNRNNSHAVGVWASGVIVLRKWTGSAYQP